MASISSLGENLPLQIVQIPAKHPLNSVSHPDYYLYSQTTLISLVLRETLKDLLVSSISIKPFTEYIF